MKKILLIVTGGIAAVKTYDLVRSLIHQGYETRVILTQSAQEFVTPMAMTVLTGRKCYTHLFDPELEADIGHISLARECDMILVAPATAHFIAQMACGLSSDLATTCILASSVPIYIAPAMNVIMWNNEILQNNMRSLEQSYKKLSVIFPEYGMMACGETGIGRMAEIDHILAAIDAPKNILSGHHILITAGATIEKIDPVRFISNFSSGKQGYALAEEAVNMGAKVTLISGHTNLPVPKNVEFESVLSADDMMNSVAHILEAKKVDFAICTAAVCDFKPIYQKNKIKKDHNTHNISLEMSKNPDILQFISCHHNRPSLVVGFAAETSHLIEYAQKKLLSKKCDVIYANDVSENTQVFGSDMNSVYEITSEGQEKLERCSKNMVAKWILNRLSKKDKTY